MIALESTPGGVIVPVRVHAAARRTQVVGEHDGALRIDVTAAPEKGKANSAVIKVLSDVLHVAKSAVELVGGLTSPKKRFLIAGVDPAQARERIEAALASD